MNKPRNVSGAVAATHSKPIPNGKLRVGICIADVWFNLLTRNPVEGLGTGARVEFVASDKGGKIGWCVHPGTLRVVEAAAQPFDDAMPTDDGFDSDIEFA